MARARSSFLRALAAVALLGSFAGCGSGFHSTKPADVGTTAVPAPTLGTTPPGEAAKAAARWETVTTLSGPGSTRTEAFNVLPTAIQWRARYSCETGTLKVNTDPPPRRPAPMVDATCPSDGTGFSITTGTVSLEVEAAGPWRMTIDQQVDTPLDEPPLPAMATATLLSQGGFYNIEKQSKGAALVYQLGDGGRALRMEDFEVNQNTDLFVWLDSATTPKTSQDVAEAEHWVLGNLKSTLGSQNYEIPASIPLDRVHSIVIWCQPVAIAYGAAGLSPA